MKTSEAGCSLEGRYHTLSDTDRLPDFFIVGAMKAGTSTLRHILNQHESIFIPDNEIFFFDIDEIEQHPDFFVELADHWAFPDYNANFDTYLTWYRSFFRNAQQGQLIGEDSTTYMASRKAPYRIVSMLPKAKLIFMLRDPVKRTYSNYWHLVSSGRAIYNFEKTLQYMPHTIIKNSLYKHQIERYKSYFPETNLKFIIFEQFIKEMKETIDDVCKFLGIPATIDIEVIDTHMNPASTPRNLRFQIAYNRFFRQCASKRYVEFLPHLNSKPRNTFIDLLNKSLINKYIRRISLTTKRRYPLMATKTSKFLQKYFKQENKDLSELIGKDLRMYWPYMDS